MYFVHEDDLYGLKDDIELDSIFAFAETTKHIHQPQK